MVRADDPLELLLPQADAALARRAQDLARFLKLLVADAQRAGAPTVGIDLERARETLEHSDRGVLVRALEDLLRHHLHALAAPDSWCSWGEPALGWAEAWRALEEAESGAERALGLPQPGESAFASSARVLEALERTAAGPLASVWRARWTHAARGAREGEALFRAVLAEAPKSLLSHALLSPALQRAALAGVAECLLERGAVREALAWLGAQPLAVSVDPRLRQLLGWTRALAGDSEGARAVLAGPPSIAGPTAGPLPLALAELRASSEAWLRLLPGRAAEHAGPISPARAGERAQFGASALIAFRYAPASGAQAVHADVAPALARRLDAWLAEREDAAATQGAREQQLVARAAAVVERAAPAERSSGAGELAATLGGNATRAVALAPFVDEDGEVEGWLHLEFEHHLAPCSARLAAAAQAWRREARARTSPAGTVPAAPPGPPRLAPGPLPDAFQALVQALGVKTAQRLWHGYAIERGEPVLVASGGEGQGFEAARAGGARALARALATGARIDFEEPDARLAVDAAAASGVVLPLVFDGRVAGLLAIESSRRRDFKSLSDAELARWSARAAPALRGAQFAAWHERRFGFAPWLPLERADFCAFASRLSQAARLSGCVVLQGPQGAGKLVFARWLHFESGAAELEPLVVHSCGAGAMPEDLLPLERAREGTLILDDVEQLDARAQERFLRWLEAEDGARASRRDARPRALATTRAPLRASAAEGLLRADLAARLDRMCLHVPGLASRRAEIPGLALALAARFARELAREAPRFADEALAAMWRQPWPGNVRELENLIYKLVLAHPGAEVGCAELAAVAREFGLALAKRLPSRHPARADLVAALATTATAAGRVNKSRAALYLGWDPDTLVARLADLGLGDEVRPEASWSGPSALFAASDPPSEEIGSGVAPAAAD